MSSDRQHRYLIAYDVTNDGRRNRVAKLLESHGDRMQYSLFVVDIKPVRLIRLQTALNTHMDPDIDSVLIADMGPVRDRPNSRLTYLGTRRRITGDGPLVL